MGNKMTTQTTDPVVTLSPTPITATDITVKVQYTAGSRPTVGGTPLTHEQMMELARSQRPPQDWYEEDVRSLRGPVK